MWVFTTIIKFKTLAFRLLGRLLVELDPEYLSEGSLYRDPFFLWKNSLES
jgi:hypothetical protein